MADENPSSNVPQSGNKIIVHHLNNSRSQRIIWLLEELEVPYEIKNYERSPEKLAPPELKNVHPLGKAPAITDGDLNIAESGAIVEYLITKYDGEKFKPTEAGWLDNLYFTHYAEGTLMPLLVNKLIFHLIPQRTPFFLRFISTVICNNVLATLVDPRLKENRAFIEDHLAKSSTGWFANGPNPTSADFMMLFPMETLQARVPSSGNSTAVDDYMRKIRERPAFKRTIEKGGEVKIM